MLELAQRGHAYVKSATRGAYRQWFTAQGVKAALVNDMPNWALATAYNDTSDEKLNTLRNGVAFWKDGAEPVATAEPVAPVAPVVHVNPAPAAVASNDELAKTVQQLITLIGQQAGKAGIDADAVRQIMRDELPNLIPVTRIELVTSTATVNLPAAPRHKQFATLLKLVAAGMHVLIVGEAGAGKTTAVEQVAKALGKKFYIQGAVSGQHELLGYDTMKGEYKITPFRMAYEHGGVCCWDELDGSVAEAVLVANSGTANCFMSFPDKAEPVARHPDFILVACANTYGNGADRVYVGRSQLDGATIDRFFTLDWAYDEKLERALAGNDAWTERVQALRDGARKEKARMIISPRASIQGAKLIAAGMTQSEVEQGLIWRGCDAELRRRIEDRANA